jgi:hypothetical protein
MVGRRLRRRRARQCFDDRRKLGEVVFPLRQSDGAAVDRAHAAGEIAGIGKAREPAHTPIGADDAGLVLGPAGELRIAFEIEPAGMADLAIFGAAGELQRAAADVARAVVRAGAVAHAPAIDRVDDLGTELRIARTAGADLGVDIRRRAEPARPHLAGPAGRIGNAFGEMRDAEAAGLVRDVGEAIRKPLARRGDAGLIEKTLADEQRIEDRQRRARKHRPQCGRSQLDHGGGPLSGEAKARCRGPRARRSRTR